MILCLVPFNISPSLATSLPPPPHQYLFFFPFLNLIDLLVRLDCIFLKTINSIFPLLSPCKFITFSYALYFFFNQK